MVKECGGLPLGVVILGGILVTKKSLSEWEMVYKKIKVHLGRGDNMLQEHGKVHKILALSYHDLPQKLKPCFLFLSMFDEDSDILQRDCVSCGLLRDDYDGRMSRAMKSQINQFKMLRVLVIEGLCPDDLRTCKDIISRLVDHLKLPKAIGKLIHLRYLSLRASLFLCLPSSIGNLHHLETLDLRAEVFRIPNVLWKLEQLRYLYFSEHFGNPKLVKLIYRFCNLRLDGLNKLKIRENFCSPPFHIKDISKLKNLLALSAIMHVEFGDPTKIIGYMLNSVHLRRTSIRLVSNFSDTTSGKLSTAVRRCFSYLNLQNLDVNGSIGNLPKYKANFCLCLIELNLYGSMISEDPMKILEMLPNLRSLGLFPNSFGGKEMQCTGLGFRQLRNLSLHQLPNSEKLWVDNGAMPNLSSLTIRYCKMLEMIPAGLRSITTLQELRILTMPTEFKERIQVVNSRKGADFHKVLHIPSIIITNY